MTIGRRVFLGVASIGAVAAMTGSTRSSASEESEYRRLQPSVAIGLGKRQAVSMSIVWLPVEGREQLPPIEARLVIFDLGGKPLVEQEFVIPPFSGVSLDYELPKGVKRQQVFAYAFIEGYAGELIGEIFAGLEVYDVLSGRTNIAAAPAALP